MTRQTRATPEHLAGADVRESWVRAPKQERARRSLERVLDAAAELLADKGFEGFSITEVCRRASVSPGSLYGRVQGKDELFLAVHERELTRMTADARVLFEDSARWRALSATELPRQAIRTLGRHLDDDAPLLRAFILRAAVDERALIQGSRANEGVEREVVNLLMTRAHDYAHPEPEVAVRTAYRLAADALTWRIAFGSEFTPEGTHVPAPTYASWVDQVAEVCGSYLLGPAPPGWRPSRPVPRMAP